MTRQPKDLRPAARARKHAAAAAAAADRTTDAAKRAQIDQQAWRNSEHAAHLAANAAAAAAQARRVPTVSESRQFTERAQVNAERAERLARQTESIAAVYDFIDNIGNPQRMIFCTLTIDADSNLFLWRGHRDHDNSAIIYTEAAHAFRLQDIDDILSATTLEDKSAEALRLRLGEFIQTTIKADALERAYTRTAAGEDSQP